MYYDLDIRKNVFLYRMVNREDTKNKWMSRNNDALTTIWQESLIAMQLQGMGNWPRCLTN